jgi:ABC-type transport system involved in multi-copper enzyme maturation permease subunit
MLSRAVRSEAGKLLRRRTTLFLVLSIALVPPALATSFTALLRRDLGTPSQWLEPTLSSPTELLLLVFGTGDLLCAVVGVLVITSEYRTLTIMRTYQAFPGRVPVLVGKLLVLVLTVLAAGAVAVVSALAVLQVFGGVGPVPSSPGRLIAGFLFNSVLVALFGYGVGLVLSRSLPTLLTVVSFIYVVPDVVRVVVSALGLGLAGLQWYLPTEASEAGTLAALQGASYLGIEPGLGAFVAAIEIAVLLALGVVVQRRRDIR